MKKIFKILITTGATIEPIDPVRYISNYSTGIMGYEIAKRAIKEGYDVCLIKGKVNKKYKINAEVIEVQTTNEMKQEVMTRINNYDCIIMAAAICDFRVKKIKSEKIKKQKTMQLDLVKNPDILLELSKIKNLIKIGFALETNNVEKNAIKKLKNKNLNFIVLNEKSEQFNPFGTGKKNYTIIKSNGEKIEFRNITKKSMANNIINQIKDIK